MFELMKNQEKLMEMYTENAKKMSENYQEMYKLMNSNMEIMKEMTEEMFKMSGMKDLTEMPKMFDSSKMFEVKVPGLEAYNEMCQTWYNENKKMMEDMFAKYMPKAEKTEKKSK